MSGGDSLHRHSCWQPASISGRQLVGEGWALPAGTKKLKLRKNKQPEAHMHNNQALIPGVCPSSSVFREALYWGSSSLSIPESPCYSSLFRFPCLEVSVLIHSSHISWITGYAKQLKIKTCPPEGLQSQRLHLLAGPGGQADAFFILCQCFLMCIHIKNRRQ